MLIHTFTFGQKLSFDDLLKVYHTDSTAFKQFCSSRQFSLQRIQNDGATTRYWYAAADSSKARLEMIYPSDTSGGNIRRLHYWFSDKKSFSHFETALRKNGFSKSSIKQPDAPPDTKAERYISKNLQVEFIQSSPNAPYWLFLHPAGQYNW